MSIHHLASVFKFFIYLYQSGFRYLFYSLVYNPILVLFMLLLKLFKLWSLGGYSVGFFSLWYTLILLFFSQYFLFFDTVKHSWILLCFPYPSTRIKHFLKKLWFPFTGEFYLETKVLGLDVLTATGVLLNSLSGQGYECVYTPTNVEIYMYNCFCIYLSRYVLS